MVNFIRFTLQTLYLLVHLGYYYPKYGHPNSIFLKSLKYWLTYGADFTDHIQRCYFTGNFICRFFSNHVFR